MTGTEVRAPIIADNMMGLTVPPEARTDPANYVSTVAESLARRQALTDTQPTERTLPQAPSASERPQSLYERLADIGGEPDLPPENPDDIAALSAPPRETLLADVRADAPPQPAVIAEIQAPPTPVVPETPIPNPVASVPPPVVSAPRPVDQSTLEQPRASFIKREGLLKKLKVASVRAGEDQAAARHIEQLAQMQRQEAKQEQLDKGVQGWAKRAVKGFVNENLFRKVADNAARTKAFSAFQLVQEKGFGFIGNDTLMAAEKVARERMEERGEKVGWLWRHLRTTGINVLGLQLIKGDVLHQRTMEVLQDWTQETEATKDGHARLTDDQIKTWREMDAIAEALTPGTLHQEVGELIANEIKLTGTKATQLQEKLISYGQQIIKHEFEKQLGRNPDAWLSAAQVRQELNAWFQDDGRDGFLGLLGPDQRKQFLESATFASDIFRVYDQLKEEMLPQALTVVDHQAGLDVIDTYVKQSLREIDTVEVGTKLYGTRTQERKGGRTEGDDARPLLPKLYDALDNIGSNRKNLNKALLDWERNRGQLEGVSTAQALSIAMGMMGNEAVALVGGVGVASWVAEASVRRLSAIATFGFFGGGVMGALKGGRQAERLMATYDTQEALGLHNANDRLRKTYGEYAVYKRDVQEAKLNIMDVLFEKDGDLFVVKEGAYKEKQITTVEDATKLATLLADVEARRTLELKHGMDLFKVGDRRQGRYMEEISAIDVLLAKGKLQLRSQLAANPDLNNEFIVKFGQTSPREVVEHLTRVVSTNLEDGLEPETGLMDTLREVLSPDELEAIFVGSKNVRLEAISNPDNYDSMGTVQKGLVKIENKVAQVRRSWTDLEHRNQSIRSRKDAQRSLTMFEMAKSGTLVAGISGSVMMGLELGGQWMAQNGGDVVEFLKEHTIGVPGVDIVEHHLRHPGGEVLNKIVSPIVDNQRVVVDPEQGISLVKSDGSFVETVYGPQDGEILSETLQLSDAARKALAEHGITVDIHSALANEPVKATIQLNGQFVQLPTGMQMLRDHLVVFGANGHELADIADVNSQEKLEFALTQINEKHGFNFSLENQPVGVSGDKINFKELTEIEKVIGGKATTLRIPANTDVLQQGDSLDLVLKDAQHPEGQTILKGIEFGRDGKILNEQTLEEAAQKAGFKIDIDHEYVASPVSPQTPEPVIPLTPEMQTVTHSVGFEEYAKHHEALSGMVQKGHALVGQSATQVGDQGSVETGLMWGGVHSAGGVEGSGITQDGSIQLVQKVGVATDGSYSVDLAQAADAHRMFLGVGEGSPYGNELRQVMGVEGKLQGDQVVFTIPKGHPLHQFFDTSGGHAQLEAGHLQTMVTPEGKTVQDLLQGENMRVDIASTFDKGGALQLELTEQVPMQGAVEAVAGSGITQVDYHEFAQANPEHVATIVRDHPLYGATPAQFDAQGNVIDYGVTNAEGQFDTQAEPRLGFAGKGSGHIDGTDVFQEGSGLGDNGHIYVMQEQVDAYQMIDGVRHEVNLAEAAREGRVFFAFANDHAEFSDKAREVIMVPGVVRDGVIQGEIAPQDPAWQFFKTENGEAVLGDNNRVMMQGGTMQTIVVPKGMTLDEVLDAKDPVPVDIAATFRANEEDLQFAVPIPVPETPPAPETSVLPILREVAVPIIHIEDVPAKEAAEQLVITGSAPTETILTPSPSPDDHNYWLFPAAAWTGRRMERPEEKEPVVISSRQSMIEKEDDKEKEKESNIEDKSDVIGVGSEKEKEKMDEVIDDLNLEAQNLKEEIADEPEESVNLGKYMDAILELDEGKANTDSSIGQIQTDEVTSLIKFAPELDPSVTQNERIKRIDEIIDAEAKTPQEKEAWLAGHNRRLGTDVFVSLQRERLHEKGEREGWDDPEGYKVKWLSAPEIDEISTKYKIPMAYMMAGGHAVLITQPPSKLPDGSYKLKYYDPFQSGEQEKTVLATEARDMFNAILVNGTLDDLIENVDVNQESQPYDRRIKQLQAISYDLSIPEVKGKEWLSRAKQDYLQETYDGYNCTLWCIYHAAIAWAAKQGDNIFKNEGLEVWKQENGFKLLTYEDVIQKNDQ